MSRDIPRLKAAWEGDPLISLTTLQIKLKLLNLQEQLQDVKWQELEEKGN